MKDNEILNAILAAAILEGDKPKPETNMREKSKKLGELMKESMLGFMDAGFTEEQAFELILKVAKGR